MRAPPLLLLAGLLFLINSGGRSQDLSKEEYVGHLSLVRYDMPRALSDGSAPTRQLAVRKVDAPDAVDWVDFTLKGKRLFQSGAEEKLPLVLNKDQRARSYFQAADDHVIQPGNHWFRAIESGARRHIYTADGTARTANSNTSLIGRYELWTFPLRISSEGPPAVKNVKVKYRGRVVYSKPGPWRSLTLLLPANEPGSQYELSVDGRAALRFDIGLMQVKLGAPREQLFRVDATLPGKPAIKVRTLSRPDRFPHRKEWAAAVSRLGKELPEGGDPVTFEGTGSLGIKVPRSPVTTYAMALPHGRSAGFYGADRLGFRGTPKQYAADLADLGFDLVFDPVKAVSNPGLPNSIESRANELAQRGIRFGLQYDQNSFRPSLQHPDLAFLAHSLSDWHAPLYRSLSLTAQRFGRFSNFAGISIGSDRAGSGSHGRGMPAPSNPWGEAMSAFTGSSHPKIPRPQSLGPMKLEFERAAEHTDEFIRYAGRHENVFRQYGYFAEAVRDVAPSLIFTTGSLGSVQAAARHDSWPWDSVPARVMFEGVPVQQACDVNEDAAGRPMELVAVIDRLRSYAPRKKTWALLDNLQSRYGREAYQRAVAMILTRGVQGIGTNFLPSQGVGESASETARYVREMNEWTRRYGGVISRMEPQAAVGIFYGHHQALLRPTVEGGDEVIGSHQGKVVEALFLSYAAGWPARVITYQELMREPLPTSMKAIMLVGLEKFDETWHWAPGLEKRLREFQNRGGKIIADDISFCPVSCERPGLNVRAETAEPDADPFPQQLARNASNIAKLRAAMEGTKQPLASAKDERAWMIPAVCGDVQYVTVLNQSALQSDDRAELLRASTAGAAKASVEQLRVPPLTAELDWRTELPVYDVALGKQLSPEEMRTADLTKSAFRWYALPPHPIKGVELVVQTETLGGSNPFYEAIVKTVESKPIRGVPVRITVERAGEKAEVVGATGWPVRLPISLADQGDWKITATELLGGHSTSVNLKPSGKIQHPAERDIVQIPEPQAVERFAKRKHVALTIALTPEQAKDSSIQHHAQTIEAYYRTRGRVVSVRRIASGDVVESLQPLRSPHRYPQWKTAASDLIVFGTPGNNVLIDDQARGRLLPPAGIAPKEGQAVLAYTRSAFVGEYDVLNVLASDSAGFSAAVAALVRDRERD